MTNSIRWMAELLSRSPFPIASLQKVPIAGEWCHRLSHRLLPSQHQTWFRVQQGHCSGIWLELNFRTAQPFIRGDAERPVQGALADYLRPGMVFYDLGANFGLFSLMASRIVGDAGEIISFEPDHLTAERLRRNIRRNDFSNITLVEGAAWSSTGTTQFLAADDSSPDRGIGRVVREGDSISTVGVPCHSLDDFVLTSRPPQAIKCDVEGAEVEVFRGAERVLSNYRPWIICEIHSKENGEAIRALLRRHGYRLREVDANHIAAAP